MTEDDCEALARAVHDEHGLADPLTLARRCGLRLCPEPGAAPYTSDGEIVYSPGRPSQAVCYFVAHELGHHVIARAGYRLDRELEEQAASRIAAALLLPRRVFLRDVDATDGDLAELHRRWPLASPWLIARRVVELRGGGAAMLDARGRRARSHGDLSGPATLHEIDGKRYHLCPVRE